MSENPNQYTILIIDDTPINLGVLTDHLEGQGFKIVIARSGKTALKRVHHVMPDLILLDVMMPEIDGFEICRRLKADEKMQDIPVIFMTALISSRDKIRGFELGAVDYVTKPLHQAEVLARVKMHLQIRDLTRSLQGKNLRLQLVHEVAQQITSILDLDELLVSVVQLIQTKFDYYFVGVWLPSETQKNAIVLHASIKRDTGQDSKQLPLNAQPNIVAKVIQTGQTYLANDVRRDTNYLALPELSDTRAEIALPLRTGSQMIGVLDIQNDQLNSFTVDDQTSLQTLADQIATAIHNAQLYSTVQQELAERQRAEAALQKANEELVQLNAEKDKFFSVVAHDLKGPFMPLLGTSELLAEMADTLEPADIKEMGQSIHRAARSLFSLLENLLLWAKAKMGQIDYQLDKTNLTYVVQQNMELLSSIATGKNITLRNRLPQSIFVHADEYMLDVVIRNLISNGLKFTANGGEVTISANVSEVASHTILNISISDTGIGIDPEDLDTLFKVSKHKSSLGTNKEIGTGLGLAICYEMLVQNGSQIWVESELDKGTTITFTMPLITPIEELSFDGPAEIFSQPIEPDTQATLEESSLTPPPPEQIAILFELAMRGDMRSIIEQAKLIEQADKQYAPFAAKLQQLARGFDEEELMELVEQYHVKRKT